MRFIKVENQSNEEYNRLITCDFDNYTLVNRYIIESKDDTYIYLNKDQIALLMEKEHIYAVCDKSGIYKIDFEKNPAEKELDELKKWKKYKDDKNQNLPLSIIFINMKEITNCKFIINQPIEYIDYTKTKLDPDLNVSIPHKSMCVGEGLYSFKIVNPCDFLSNMLGIRESYTKQELIERIRKDILASIEHDIKSSDEKYTIPLKLIKSKKNNISITADSNEYDKKIKKYGIKITSFSIEQFDEYETKREKKNRIKMQENQPKFSKLKKGKSLNIKLLDTNHIKLSFSNKGISILNLEERCNLCDGLLDSDLNYCLKCGTKINKNIL